VRPSATASLVLALGIGSLAADWPQFMRCPEHTGDAADEELSLPLGLVAQVQLGDAVTTSPAIVAGRAYIVDQMGTAYCVDPMAGRILWQAAPDGPKAMGSNTSSPCVANGRVCYGTTAGSFHILDAADGKVIKTLALGSPILCSPTLANDSVYLQTVEPTLYCLDLDGNVRWTWDHYTRYGLAIPDKLKHYHPRSYDRPHYGGGEVAVAGRKIVTAFGWDQVCLEDKGNDAAVVWGTRAALGKDEGIPAAPSIAGGYVYTAWPGVDGAGSLVRFALADGSFHKGDQRSDQWAILGTAAVRGNVAYAGRHVRGVSACEFGKGTHWESFHWARPQGFTPTISSPALAKDHCAFTTLDGELIAVPLAARGSDLAKIKPEPFRFKTPHGKVIASSPAISGGCVYFGCDDGFFYVLGPGGDREPRQEKLTLHDRRSHATSATGKRYAWPSPYGNPANTNYVDDPGLKPPFRLRWAARCFGVFKQPASATEDDIVYVSLAGTVVCLEQDTARIRWRRRLPLQTWARHGALCANGRIYVPRPRQGVKPGATLSALCCLDAATGDTLWQADIGMCASSRAAPALANGVVAFGSRYEGGPAVEAWDAITGKTLWRIELDARGDQMAGPNGCADGATFYFSVGQGKWQWKQEGDAPRGQTVAIEGRSGRILWTASDAHASASGTPTIHGGKLYLIDNEELLCLAAADGKLLWKERVGLLFHSPAVSPECLTARGYSGSAERRSLTNGKPESHQGRTVQLGGPEHACGPALLASSGISIAVTVGGLYVRDVRTGELLWLSKGFAPRTCSNAIAANGRVFVNPQVNGVLYCFEPEGK